jgi:hypothetical protein
MCILEQRSYKPGEQAPKGYLAWHEWALAQHKAGLRQIQCGHCGLWYYPQELDHHLKSDSPAASQKPHNVWRKATDKKRRQSNRFAY